MDDDDDFNDHDDDLCIGFADLKFSYVVHSTCSCLIFFASHSYYILFHNDISQQQQQRQQ
jgi:hypothetical protein